MFEGCSDCNIVVSPYYCPSDKPYAYTALKDGENSQFIDYDQYDSESLEGGKGFEDIAAEISSISDHVEPSLVLKE